VVQSARLYGWELVFLDLTQDRERHASPNLVLSASERFNLDETSLKQIARQGLSVLRFLCKQGLTILLAVKPILLPKLWWTCSRRSKTILIFLMQIDGAKLLHLPRKLSSYCPRFDAMLWVPHPGLPISTKSKSADLTFTEDTY